MGLVPDIGCKDDAEVQRLRELSIDYIREAERLEIKIKRVTTREPAEQISAAFDAIARDFFARAQNRAKE